MPFSLLNVDGHVSLEFNTSDLDALRLCIQELYGEVSGKTVGIVTVVAFGGEDFTFQNEWDDPCLISHSVNGNDLLRTIHAQLCAG